MISSNINYIYVYLYNFIDTNLYNLSSFLSNIDHSIKYCQSALLKSVSNIDCINGLITNKDSLHPIKDQMIELHPKFLNLYDKFGYIHLLKNEANSIITSNKDKVCLLINGFRCSLSEFNTIESLIICIRSIIQEISESKEEFLISISKTENLQSNDLEIKSLCDNIDRLFSAISDVEFYTYCLKYWICKFVNSSNINTLSTSHCVNYINYFYHLFPLHLNSFNFLFSDVISPKLSILICSVSKFTCLISDIDSFICSLKGVSSYLNYNPAESLLNIINKFNSQNYVDEVKKNIIDMITELENKIKYDQIIGQVKATQSWIVASFNKQLKKFYRDFKNNIEEQKKSLGEEIKNYIQKIEGDLGKYCTCVKELIELISKAIQNLDTNQSRLDLFNEYNSKEKLARTCTYLDGSLTNQLEDIVKAHNDYKKCLTNSCTKITSELNKLKEHLAEIKDCSEKLTSELNSSEVPSTSKIAEVLSELQSFKSTLETNFDKHDECFQKLEKINEHITTMKTKLQGVKGKVDPEAAKYINDLKEINIDAKQVEKDIKQIKATTELVINKLEIAKSAIKFHKDLEDELGKLSDVTFHDYDFTPYFTVKGKLSTFQSTINPAIQKAEEEIEKFKEQCAETQEPTKREEDESISCNLRKLQEYYNKEIPKITSSIDSSLKDIEIIKIILPSLEENKNNSPKISDIRCKICNISDLNDAIATLPKIKDCLDTFVKLQEKTKSLIDDFSSYPKLNYLDKYSRNLQDSISSSCKLINFINYYIDYFNTIKYLDSVTKWIKSSYKSTIERINQIFDNFKTYVEVITSKLETINSNICLLKSTISACWTGYNNSVGVNNHDLGKLKDYINTLKFYLTKIKTDFTTIKVFLDKIKQESSYIDQNKSELQKIVDGIECYTKCNRHLGTVVDYLIIIIKYKILEIFKIEHMIIKSLNINTIKNIESKINEIDQSIIDLECAIEGVARNMIQCSLKSLSNHLTNSNNCNSGLSRNSLKNDPIIVNLSMVNLTNYKDVLNRLFQCLKKIDQIIKLIIWFDFCYCVLRLELLNINRIEFGIINVHKIVDNLASKSSGDFDKSLKLDQIKKMTGSGMKENHFCLCMIVKYLLYPTVIQLTNITIVDMEMLSTMSRKFDKYSYSMSYRINLSKLIMVTIELIQKIINWLKLKYHHDWIKYKSGDNVKCLCSYYQDPIYYSIVSITLFLSSLIENIWRADNNWVLTAINHLSSLLSEYQSIHVYTNYYSPSLYKMVRNALVGLNKVKLVEGTSYHSVKASKENNKSLISSNITGTSTLSESRDGSTTSTYTITTGASRLLNTSIKTGLKSLRIMILGTLFSKEGFALIYSKLSAVSYYIANSSIGTTASFTKSIKNPGLKICFKYLNEICQQEPQPSCHCTNINECKICPKGRTGISCLSTSLKLTKFAISTVSGDMLLNYLIGSNASLGFFWNLCVGFTEAYTAMLKNINLPHHQNSYHKNIANSFPSLTVGYAYDTVYEHQTTGNSSYTGINGIREGYPKSRSGIIAIINKMKEKERANIYTLEYLHTGVKSQNNIRSQQ